MSRDFAAEMRTIIDAETAHGPYSSPVVAAHIVAKLRATDPDLLAGWLDAQAVNFIRHAINLRDCATRTHARLTAGRSVFRSASDAHESGDSDALGGWLQVVHVVEGGTRKRLADMYAGDLDFAASEYAQRAAENALAESFLRALARKVGSGTVKDHYSNEQLAAMWQSLAGR